MRERLICIAALALFVMFVAAPSFAQGLLGDKYYGFEIGLTTAGNDDITDIDDSVFCDFGFNVPMSENVDALISLFGSSFSYSKMEGDTGQNDIEETSMGVLAGINYHFTPDRNVNPYVGVQVGFVRTETDASSQVFHSYRDENISESFSLDGNDFAFSLGGGIEVDISDQAALRPNIVYYKISDEDDIAAGLSLNIWFNDSFYGRLSTSYAFDVGDASYAVGLGFGF